MINHVFHYWVFFQFRINSSVLLLIFNFQQFIVLKYCIVWVVATNCVWNFIGEDNCTFLVVINQNFSFLQSYNCRTNDKIECIWNFQYIYFSKLEYFHFIANNNFIYRFVIRLIFIWNKQVIQWNVSKFRFVLAASATLATNTNYSCICHSKIC